MAWMKEEEIIGADLNWYACDQNGHVGLFTSFMTSRLQESIAKDREGFFLVDEFFEQRVIHCGFELVGEGRGDLAIWISAAKKGLFSFDGSGNGQGPLYRMLARPVVPIEVSELDPAIGKILRQTRALACSQDLCIVDNQAIFGPWTQGKSSS